MKSILVLSHLMSKEGNLGSESIQRTELAINLFKTNEYNFIITSGWAYHPDCKDCICDVIKNYIIKKTKINSNKIITLSKSRDTVGDAFFSRELAQKYDFKKIVVITSDYHVARTKKIFNKFFLNISDIEIIGVNTYISTNEMIIKKEEKSLKSFEKTFNSIDFNNNKSIYNCLLEKHPYYNGQVYPKLY